MVDTVKLEQKWQKRWAMAQLGTATPDKRKKFFMIFAYPGISGYLHVGHMRGFSYTDIVCRYKRMRGYNVLYPVGTHASGMPAVGFAAKIKRKDKTWIKYLEDNGCPKKLIPKLGDPAEVVKYFNKVYVEDYWKKFGFLCDWDRFTCTTWNDYEKFIQWQFKKLYQNNLLVQKPYYATFCPSDGPVAVDPSETDISKGGNAEKHEYTLLKFKFGEMYLVAATLRPDTVYGQTNLWINPDYEYVTVEVNDEIWVMSAEAGEKLGYQIDDVKVLDKIDVKSLLGKTALAPGIEKELPILPSHFVDPAIGSGVVTCVPSDAPYDHMALEELKKNTTLLKKYKIDASVVDKIEYVSIIELPGYGKFPAVDLCKKLKINSLADKDKLETATKELYKLSFHNGKMKKSCGSYSGNRVDEAKEMIKQDLIEKGKADVFHDLSEEVVCRCGEKVVVKRIDDQWFIKYSDEKLTKKALSHSKTMNVYPDEYQRNLPNVLNWFMDRACVRMGSWLGSKFPYDKKWIVEPIADSTLYPIYYLISPYVNSKQLKLENLTEEFFDFVFLGKGTAKKALWKQIRKDVEYWYPLDINLGGKEHQTVHFPVFVMNHVGVLDKKFWPKGIFVNYWVTGKAGKISKSKGGAEPIPGAIEKYSVDGMRLYYAHVGSPHSEIVWDQEIVLKYRHAVDRIFVLIGQLLDLNKEKAGIDEWIVSRVHERLDTVTKSLDELDLRSACTRIFYGMYEDLRWYMRRGGGNKKVIQDVIETWAHMLCPITPHTAEEIWEKVGGKGLLSESTWPKANTKKIQLEHEAHEDMIKNLLEDTRSVMKLAKINKPKQIILYIADTWKYAFLTGLKKQLGSTRNIGEIMKKVMQDENVKKNAKSVTKLVQRYVKDPSKLPHMITNQTKEMKSLKESTEFLQKEFNCIVTVVKSSDHPGDAKAEQAMPGKPAILVE